MPSLLLAEQSTHFFWWVSALCPVPVSRVLWSANVMTVILHLGTVLMESSFLLIHGKDVGLVNIVDVVGQLDVQ